MSRRNNRVDEACRPPAAVMAGIEARSAPSKLAPKPIEQSRHRRTLQRNWSRHFLPGVSRTTCWLMVWLPRRKAT